MIRPGVWIGASYALGRNATVAEPYPHICGMRVAGRMTAGLTVRLWRKECAACIQEQHDEQTAGRAPPDGWQETDRRRVGEGREDD